MEDFAYLSYDAATNKTSLTNDFVDQMIEAFKGLGVMRTDYLKATDAVMAAQKSYDDAKAEATANGLIGKNAEERAANLDLALRPLHDFLIEKKRWQRAAEHSMQSCSDTIRMFEDVLQSVQAGVVFTTPFATTPDMLIKAGMKGLGLT